MFTDLNSSSKSLKIRSKYASEIPEWVGRTKSSN
jgi:hypothetical protein